MLWIKLVIHFLHLRIKARLPAIYVNVSKYTNLFLRFKQLVDLGELGLMTPSHGYVRKGSLGDGAKHCKLVSQDYAVKIIWHQEASLILGVVKC